MAAEDLILMATHLWRPRGVEGEGEAHQNDAGRLFHLVDVVVVVVVVVEVEAEVEEAEVVVEGAEVVEADLSRCPQVAQAVVKFR